MPPPTQHQTPPPLSLLPRYSSLPPSRPATSPPTLSPCATASSSAPQVTETTANGRQRHRPRTAAPPPPRFTVTPTREAAAPSISLVSPTVDLAGPRARGPGAVERISGQARGECRSAAAEVGIGASPIKRLYVGQPSIPTLSNATGRAEMHVKGKAVGKGKGKGRTGEAGEGELERGLDRVFTRHDQAKSLAGAGSVFRGTGRKTGSSSGVLQRLNTFSSAYNFSPHEDPATPPRWSNLARPHDVLQLLTPSTTAPQHHQLFSNFETFSAFDRVSSRPTPPTPVPMHSHRRHDYQHDGIASWGRYSVPAGVGKAVRDEEVVAHLALGPPRVVPKPCKAELEEEDEEEDEETCARIDAVAVRIQAMALEGQQALETPLPSSEEEYTSDHGGEGKGDILGRWKCESEEEGGDLWDLVFGGAVGGEEEDCGPSRGQRAEQKAGAMELQAHRKTASSEERGCGNRPVLVRCRSVGLLAASGVDVL